MDRGGKAVERDPRALERSHHLDAAHIAGREPILLMRAQDSELHQPADIVDLNTGTLGGLRS